MKDIESLSFEQCYERLEQVIESLEAGDLELEQSVKLYEEGMRLAEQCGQRLDDAQLKVNELLAAAADDDPGAPGSDADWDSEEEEAAAF